jgi:hypothetical protein
MFGIQRCAVAFLHMALVPKKYGNRKRSNLKKRELSKPKIEDTLSSHRVEQFG